MCAIQQLPSFVVLLIYYHRVEEPGQRIRKFSDIYIDPRLVAYSIPSQKSNSQVIFDVMNEPNGIDAQTAFNLVRKFSPSP